jgi:hypothetical protein
MHLTALDPSRSGRSRRMTMRNLNRPLSDASHRSVQRVRCHRIGAAVAAAAAAGSLVTAGPASATGVSPAQLTAAGWTCIQPRLFPTLLLCAPPGAGLPPLPGTTGFADRAPSYKFQVFASATGEHLGTELLLRPDIYQQGQPPCPQQPGGQFIYNPRNDLWFCNRFDTNISHGVS